MSVNLTIDEETAKRVITAAILQSMGDGERDAIIGQAVAWLAEPRSEHSGYGAKRSTPLEDAYRNAVDMYVNRVVREVIEADEVLRTQIEQQLREFVAQWTTTLEAHGDDLRSKVTETVITYVTEKQRSW